jgi:signal transduction histidine kinase
LFYAPFYKNGDIKVDNVSERREDFVGLVYAPFIFENLLQGTLDQSRRAISLRIEDGGFVPYDESSEKQSGAFYEENIVVNMYGREWIFSIWSRQSFREQNSSSQPLIILFGGIFIDSLLFALFFLISKRNFQAASLASEMTRQNRKKTQELEMANAGLQEFSYRTSHDLRSPLTSSISLLNFSINAINSNKTEKALASLDHASHSLQQLQCLVEGILDLAKATHLEEQEEIVSVADVLSEVLDKFVHMENADRITFYKDIDQLKTLTTKKNRFQLILENLISNAIKYQDTAKELSWVKISAVIEGEYFVFSIEDNGLGIPENMQSQMFSMFKRFHTKVSQGSGLGLYMVKKSAMMLRGEISFSNGENDVGATFNLTIKV